MPPVIEGLGALLGLTKAIGMVGAPVGGMPH